MMFNMAAPIRSVAAVGCERPMMFKASSNINLNMAAPRMMKKSAMPKRNMMAVDNMDIKKYLNNTNNCSMANPYINNNNNNCSMANPYINNNNNNCSILY